MGTDSRMLAASRPGAVGGGATVDEPGLSFALSFMSGRGLLTTRDRRVGPVLLKALAMEIPSISFPFDVSGGAERFKPRRCALRYMALGIDAQGVQAALTPAALANNGLSDVRVGIYDGFLEVAGVFRIGEQQADFTCRAALLPLGPHELQVVFYDTRFWGWLPLPAALLPVYLRRSLGHVPFGGTRAGAWTLRPGDYFARDVLPRSGWKIPDMRGAHVVGAEVARGQVSLTIGRVDDPSAKQIAERSPPPAALRAADGIATFASAEEKLAIGQVREAYTELRDALDEGRGGAWARERLLQIGASDPELTQETRTLAQETLERTTDDLPALLALAAIAQRDGQTDAAVAYYGRLAELMRERKDRFDVVAAELALGASQQEHDPDHALAAYERAATRAHDSAPVQERVMRLRRKLGNMNGAAEAGERWAALVQGDAARAAAYAELGRIYLHDCNDFRRSRVQFEKAMRLVPDAPAALEGMAETYAARGEPARAASFLARLAEQAESSNDTDRIVSLNLRLGEIWQNALHDPESAAARYQRALTASPDSHAPRLLLAQLAEDRGDTDKARRLYEEVIARIESNDQTDAPAPELMRAYGRLGNLLAASPAHYHAAVECLSRALQLDAALPNIAATLARLLRERQDWGRLIDVLENLALHSRNPVEVRAAWLEAARLEIEELKNPAAAQTYLETVLDAQPQDHEALALLAPILLANGQTARLAHRLDSAAQGNHDPHARAELLYRLAEAQQATGSEPRVRRRTLEQVLEANPQHQGAARALVDLLRGEGDIVALAAAYDRLAVATGDPTGRAAALLAKARLLAASPGQAASALAAVQAAVAAEAASVEGWLLGSQVLVASGDVPRARLFLRDALTHFGDKPPQSLHLRLAELARQERDVRAETEALAAAIAVDSPTQDVAQRYVALLIEQNRGREALPLLMRWADANAPIARGDAWLLAARVHAEMGQTDEAIALYEKALGQGDAIAQQAALALEALARHLNRPADVARALRAQLERAPQDTSALSRLMQAQREAGDHAAAMATAEQLLENAPQNVAGHRYLAEQLEARGQWQQALDHWLYMALVCPAEGWERKDRRDTFARAAGLARDVRPSALPTLQETFDSQFPELPPDALSKTLGDILRQEGAWQKLLSLREMQLPQASSTQTIAYRRELAEILHKQLKRPQDALPHYESASAADPHDVAASDALVSIYTELQRWGDLANLHFALGQLVDDTQVAIRHVIAASQLYAEKLDDTVMAQQIMRTLFDRHDLPTRDGAFLTLLRKLELRAELAQLIETDLAEAPSAEDSRFTELVRLLSGPLNDPARALTWCERMRDAFPNTDTPRRLGIDILKAHTDLGPATPWLQDWAQAREGHARAEVLTELAQWAHDRGDEQAAMAALAQAAESDPDDLTAVDLLIERHKARGEWTQVLHWLLRAADAVPQGEERDRRLRRALSVATDYAQDPGAAIMALSKLSAPTTADDEALAQMYCDAQDWPALAAWKGFGTVDPEVLLRAALATGKSGPLPLAETYIQALLDRGEYVEAAWDVASDAWRRAGKLAELGRWRLAFAEHAAEENRLWLRLVGRSELLEAGEPVQSAITGSLEEEFASADLTKIPTAWAVFLASRAINQRDWLNRAALALQKLLGESDPRLINVLRARVQHELDGGDAQVAVDLARRLVVLGDESASEWLESALAMAGQGDELLEVLQKRAQRGGPDAATLWTRVGGLLADKHAFAEASEALQRVPAEARTKRWGELQFGIGRDDKNPRMLVAGAQVAAQFCSDPQERANWLRLAGHSLWWDLSDREAGILLLQQAQALHPLTLQQVDAQTSTSYGEALYQQLEEALAVLDSEGTAPLWRELATLRPAGSSQIDALETASKYAGNDTQLLERIVSTAKNLGVASLHMDVLRRLMALQPETYFPQVLEELDRRKDYWAWVELIENAEDMHITVSTEQIERAAHLCATELQAPTRALEFWDRSIVRKPNEVNLSEALKLSREQGALQQAVDYGDLLLNWLPQGDSEREPVLRIQLDMLEAMGQRERARQMRRALVDNGWGTAADKLLLAQDNADLPPAEAAMLLEQVAQEGEEALRGPALVAAAEAWQRASDRERAAASLRKAIALGQDTLEVHRMGIALLDGGDALFSVRRILELSGDAKMAGSERAALRLRLAEAEIETSSFQLAEDYLNEAARWDTSDSWALLMERVLEGLGKRVMLADLYLDRSAQGPWHGDALAERLQRAAQIFAQEKRPDDERRALALVATLQPNDPAVADRLFALTAAQGDRAAFAGLLDERFAQASDAKARLDLSLQASALWLEHYSDAEAAARPLERCLAEGTSEQLLDTLRDLYARLDKKDAFIDLLRRRAEMLQGAERMHVLLYAANLAESHDPVAAYNLYLDAVRQDPTLNRPVEFCLEHGTKQNQWGDVLEVLELRIGCETAVAERVQLQARAATIARDALHDSRRAVRFLQEALQGAPQAYDLREKLVRLHIDQDDPMTAAQVLTSGPEAPDGALALAQELAGMLQARNSDTESLLAWTAKNFPDAPESAAYNLRQARARGDNAEVLTGLQRRLEQEADMAPQERANLRAEAAELAAGMAQNTLAIDLWLQALQGPEPRAAWLMKAAQAAQALNEQALVTGVTEAVVHHRGMARDAADNAQGAEKGAWLQLLAAAYMHINEDNNAVASLEELLDLTEKQERPLPEPATETLIGLYQRYGAWRPLAQLHRRVAMGARTPEAQARSWYEAALLWRDKLDEPGQALEALRAVLDIEHAHKGAQLSAGMLLAQRHEYDEARPLLDASVEVDAADVPLEQLRALLACYEHGGDPARTIALSERVLAREPNAHDVLLLRATLLDGNDRADDAESQWRAYLEAGTDDTQANARAHERLAAFALARNDAVVEAEHLEKALQLRPDDASLITRLRQAQEKSGNITAVVRLRRQEAEAETNPEVQAAHYLALSEVYGTQLDDAAEAQRMLERAADALPRDVPLLKRLIQSYRDHNEPTKFLLSAERLLAMQPDINDAAFLGDLAVAYESVDIVRAHELYGKALQQAPDDQALRDKHHATASAAGDWSGFVAGEEAAIEALEDPIAKGARLVTLADAYIQQVGDLEKAIAALTRACAVLPAEENNWRKLADAYALDAQYYTKAVELYRRLLTAAPLDDGMLRILARIAGQMGETDRAYGYYAALLCVVPADEEAERFVKACRAARPALPSRALTDAERQAGLHHPQLGGPIEDLFAPLARFAELTQPTDLSKRGITERDALPAEDARVQALTPLLKIVGVPPMTFHTWPAGGYRCDVELQQTPALLLGLALADSQEARQRAFVAARAAELYRTGHTLCERLPGPELQNVIGALCIALDPSTKPQGATAETLRWSQTMAAPMNQQVRAAMAPRAQAYLKAAPNLDVNRWRAASAATASRVALLLSCDVEEGVVALLHAQVADELPREQMRALLQESAEALDLFRFAQSDLYFSLRRALGIALRRAKPAGPSSD